MSDSMPPRKSYRTPKLTVLVPIAEVANMMGIPKWKAGRRLESLWASDAAKGQADWRVRVGSDTGQILINLEALRERHPALFERRYVSRHEFESMIDRQESFEKSQRSVIARVAALERAKASA